MLSFLESIAFIIQCNLYDSLGKNSLLFLSLYWYSFVYVEWLVLSWGKFINDSLSFISKLILYLNKYLL